MEETGICTGVFSPERMEWQSMASVAMLTEAANRFKSRIVIQHGGATVNAKSLISLMMLDIACQTAVTVTAHGCDAPAAIAAITQMAVA